MSGGSFDYGQYRIREIADDIQYELKLQGTPKPKNELWHDQKYYKEYPEELNYPAYSKEVQEKFHDAVEILKKAYVYAERIDWFLSGDDGEESFLKRLKEDLDGTHNDSSPLR